MEYVLVDSRQQTGAGLSVLGNGMSEVFGISS